MSTDCLRALLVSCHYISCNIPMAYGTIRHTPRRPVVRMPHSIRKWPITHLIGARLAPGNEERQVPVAGAPRRLRQEVAASSASGRRRPSTSRIRRSCCSPSPLALTILSRVVAHGSNGPPYCLPEYVALDSAVAAQLLIIPLCSQSPAPVEVLASNSLSCLPYAQAQSSTPVCARSPLRSAAILPHFRPSFPRASFPSN